MGRESSADLRFADQSGVGKILLESDALILRGGLRLTLPRAAITGFAAQGDDLVVETTAGQITARLGAKEAALWVKALAKPPPSLADKLGVGPHSPARLLWPATDPALVAALNGNLRDDARLLIAELETPDALDRAAAVLAAQDFSAFWGVTRKGAGSPLSESALRARLRSEGCIDTKSCAVSETRSATRFQRR